MAIIGILAMISVPMYVGQQMRAARTEAWANLQNLRLLDEQYYAENGNYAASTGACAQDNGAANTAALQLVLPNFKPGALALFSYCIEQNVKLDGTAQTPCFRARAFGNSNTRVSADEYRIDCNNDRTF